MQFLNTLSSDQRDDLEIEKIIESDVVVAVYFFFDQGVFPNGSNSSFIALIPKSSDANMVKDYRPISLIGSLYKIIAKILANRLVNVLGNLVNECGWIRGCLKSARGSIIVNGSPTEEFQFYKGLKQGDPLSSFLFILVMESLHISFQRVVDAGMRINMNKSKLMGVSVEDDKVDITASKIGCFTFKTPFSYLVLIRVLQRLESIRSHLFNGNDLHGKKMSWVKWEKVLAFKENGGLGVSSLYALNRGLLLKWVWKFITQSTSLWARVIKALHGEYGKMKKNAKSNYPSIWLDIVHEMETLKNKGIIVSKYIKIKLGNRDNTMFWDDIWCGDIAFKYLYPRLYALELYKSVKVASKLSQSSLELSFRRIPRGGTEEDQLLKLTSQIEGVMLSNSSDRWTWSLEGSGEFLVASVRKLIDDKLLPVLAAKTRWIKAVPLKINIHAWKVSLDCLPTRINISHRGIDIESILCPMCDNAAESASHLFFTCRVAKEVFRKILCWWDVDYMDIHSYKEWVTWIMNLHLSLKHKKMLEGVCYVMW
ncbi:RNA-directed DNA polymerase, eukaryota, reverse transcriptase zinc-binding domain protein [Tanacetum coccineum]